MTTTTLPFGSVPTSRRSAVPATIDATRWESLGPLYAQLLSRTLKCESCLENLILDRSELDAAASEAEANLYINMTRRTSDAQAQGAFTDFVENVEPKLRTIAFELDRKIAPSPFVERLDQQRYGVVLRRLKVDVVLLRE